jgi:hypothetical protein
MKKLECKGYFKIKQKFNEKISDNKSINNIIEKCPNKK